MARKPRKPKPKLTTFKPLPGMTIMWKQYGEGKEICFHVVNCRNDFVEAWTKLGYNIVS